MDSSFAKLVIEPPEVGSTCLRVTATACNWAPETAVRLYATAHSYCIGSMSGAEEPWRFAGVGVENDSGVLIEPDGARTWETIIPISRRFEFLGPEHPGFVELLPGSYTLQLICNLDWLLPIAPYPKIVRDAILADKFVPTLCSNVIQFQVI